MEKDEKTNFRWTQRWLKLIQSVPLIKKPELLDGILEET
jgi:hypothetical protein